MTDRCSARAAKIIQNKQCGARELKVRLGKKTFVRRKHWVNEGRQLKRVVGGMEAAAAARKRVNKRRRGQGPGNTLGTGIMYVFQWHLVMSATTTTTTTNGNRTEVVFSCQIAGRQPRPARTRTTYVCGLRIIYVKSPTLSSSVYVRYQYI